MRCFRTAELYFYSLIDSFDILAISEHCLFDEQLGTLTSKCNNNYNCIAASSNENPPILSGKVAHRGVALLWKISLDNYISPLENIDSNRIVTLLRRGSKEGKMKTLAIIKHTILLNWEPLRRRVPYCGNSM